MYVDKIFRGLMRPPAFMGVPMIPFMLVMGVLAVAGFMFSLWLFWTMPLALLIMRHMVRQDELIFDLLAVRIETWKVSRQGQPVRAGTTCLEP